MFSKSSWMWTSIWASVALAAATAHAAPTAYVSNERGGVSIIDLSDVNATMDIEVGGRGPRGIAVTADGRYLLTANKESDDVSVIDTRTRKVVKRIPIGQKVEFIRIHGGMAYVTYEPGGPGKPDGKGEGKGEAKGDAKGEAKGEAKPGAAMEKDDDDVVPAEIAVLDLKKWKVVRTIRSGRETEGIAFSADGRRMLVTNEGDDTVSVYEARTGKLVTKIATGEYGKRPRGIAAIPGGKGYVVTLEFSDKVLVIDAAFKPVRTAPTKKSPYGLAFDATGKRLFVASGKSGVLQVLDATSLEAIAEIPVGQRCWHFSFTPDNQRVLVACGKSDSVHVIDAETYQPVAVLHGMAGPWGIVTSPKSIGSLDSP